MSQTKSHSKPTAEQARAIETRHVSVVLSAGAGCGKTTVLTQRFLSHLEPGPDAVELSRLVAITFTERAAREMRERIRARCLDRLRTCDPGQAGHWLKITRALDSARISTIHGFCSGLLRAHAVEAEIDPKFALLDDMLGPSFLGNAVEGGLHELLAEENHDAAELVFEFGLSRTKGLLHDLVMQRYRINLEQWQNYTPSQLATYWESHWRNTVLPARLRELAESQPARRLLDLLHEPVSKHRVMQERCQFICEALPHLASAADPAAQLEKLRENAQIRGGGTKKDWHDEEVYEEAKDLLADLRGKIDKLLGQLEYDPAHLQRGAEISLCALRATQRIGAFYDQQKRDAAVLDFDDLLLNARNLLRDHESVRKRVAAGISLLMVDEFQDTDPVQDEMVQMLSRDDSQPGKLFVVGDSKQSIYRFRRAEPKVFHELRERTPEAGRLPLSTNFRSREEILRFVNVLFDGALESEYEALRAGLPPVTAVAGQQPPPCIEFLFAVPQPEEETETEESDDLADTRRRREARWIAHRIQQLLADATPRIREKDKVTGEYRLRRVFPKDIVILFRAMSDVRYYEEGLRDLNIDYYVVGGRAFFAQQEIFDIVNLCQYLDNVDDAVALIGVLRSPLFSLSDDAILALGEAPAEALTAAPPTGLPPDQQALVQFAGQVLQELRALKDRLPIAGLLNLAIEKTGYDAALLTEFMGERKLANLRKLVDMARQFDQSGLFTLADFVERLRDAVAEETHEPLAATHPESADILRLMTIHQSKGLEFPVVFVADMDRQGRNQMSDANFDPQLGPVVRLPSKFGSSREYPAPRMLQHSETAQDLAETRRVLYVAATRAADLLILSANFKKSGVPAEAWLKLVSERFDLSTGAIRMTPTKDGLSLVAKYGKGDLGIRVHQQLPELGPKSESSGQGKAPPLSKLRETLSQVAPAPLPELSRPIPPSPGAARPISVSTLEEIDRHLRPTTHATPLVEQPAASEPFAATQLGILVHQALERVDFRNPAPVDALVERSAASLNVSLAPAVIDTARKCVQNLLDSPVADELAAARAVYREIDFLWQFPGGAADSGTISGTLDCLYETADRDWVVLDYKTGLRSPDTTPDQLRDDYEIQLGLYARAVQQFTGKLPSRIELVFLRQGAERVVFEPTAGQLKQIETRVQQALESARTDSLLEENDPGVAGFPPFLPTFAGRH
ncbi:MAG: UvrD-helicase domain-containing protein [Planctomycetes bacterium]|nr:UvrD-helicase domain-containing protein [Planctomycetota bacterium]